MGSCVICRLAVALSVAKVSWFCEGRWFSPVGSCVICRLLVALSRLDVMVIFFYGSKSSKVSGGGGTGSFMYDMLVSCCHVTIRCDGRILR